MVQFWKNKLLDTGCQDFVPTHLHVESWELFSLLAKCVWCLVAHICVNSSCHSWYKMSTNRSVLKDTLSLSVIQMVSTQSFKPAKCKYKLAVTGISLDDSWDTAVVPNYTTYFRPPFLIEIWIEQCIILFMALSLCSVIPFYVFIF